MSRSFLAGLLFLVLLVPVHADDKKGGKTKADFKVTSDELCKEFESKKDATNAKYQGKTLQVTGPLQFKKDSGTNTIIMLRVKDSPKGVECWLKAGEKSKLPETASDQTVTLVGKYGENKELLQLGDVEIISVGKATTKPK